MNALANKFVEDWELAIEKYVDENKYALPAAYLPVSLQKMKTQYDKIYWYFMTMFDDGYKNIRTFKKTYTTPKGKVVIRLKIKNVLAPRSYGDIRPEPDDVTGQLNPVVSIYIPTQYTNKLAMSVDEYDELDYNQLRDFIADVKKTVAHEITHYYQYVMGLDPGNNYQMPKNMYGNYTNFLTMFRYMTQDSEAESFVAEGYKLFKERYNTKSLYDCVVLALLDVIDVNYVKDYYDGYLSMADLLDELKPNERFTILWFLYVYIPEKHKDSKLFQFQDEHIEEIHEMFDAKILKRNRENIIKFLNYITKHDLEREFNSYLRKEIKAGRGYDLESEFFSLTTSNKKYLDSLA